MFSTCDSRVGSLSVGNTKETKIVTLVPVASRQCRGNGDWKRSGKDRFVVEVDPVNAEYRFFIWGARNTPTLLRTWGGRQDEHVTQLCTRCRSIAARSICRVCGLALPLHRCSKLRRAKEHVFPRCTNCCNVRSQCGVAVASSHDFVTASALCIFLTVRCNAQFATVTNAAAFDRTMFCNHRNKRRAPVC